MAATTNTRVKIFTLKAGKWDDKEGFRRTVEATINEWFEGLNDNGYEISIINQKMRYGSAADSSASDDEREMCEITIWYNMTKRKIYG